MRKATVTISLVCTLALLFICITGCWTGAEQTNDRETVETKEKSEALPSETEAESKETAEETSSEPEQISSEDPEETSSEMGPSSSEDTGTDEESFELDDYGISIMADKAIDPGYLKTIKTYFDERIENYFGNTVSKIDWIAEEETKRIEKLNAWAASLDFEIVEAENQLYIMDVLEETEEEIVFLVDELNTLLYRFSYEKESRTMTYEDWHVMHMSKENYSIISQSYVEEYIYDGYLYGDDKEVQFILAHGEIPWDEVRK